MDALMICLLASAIAAFGGRWWLLIAGFSRYLPGWALILAMFLSAGAGAMLAAAAGGAMALQFRGPGMLLFLAIAIISAGAGLCWPAKPLNEKVFASATSATSATIILLAAMVGDSAPFIIAAAAARTGSPALAGFGGCVGLIAIGGAAMTLWRSEIPYRGVQRIRWVAGIGLTIIGGVMALSALGRI